MGVWGGEDGTGRARRVGEECVDRVGAVGREEEDNEETRGRGRGGAKAMGSVFESGIYARGDISSSL